MGSVLRGRITLESVIEAGEWPKGWVRNAGDNFNHQFEAPMFFFAVGLILIQLGVDSALAVGLAWFFVATRVAHGFVQLTFNHIPTRFFLFLAGFVAVGCLVIIGLLKAFA